MSASSQKQPLLKKITTGLTVGTVVTGSTFFHGPPVLALGLTKLFKKCTGTTPSAYIKSCQNNDNN